MARHLHTGGNIPTLGILLLLVCAPVIPSACGQVTMASSAARPTPQRAPLHHLYWHFLLYQNHLDRQASVLEDQGKDGGPLRNQFQKELQFNDQHFRIVREAGLRLETDLDALNEKIRPVIFQDRLWIQKNGRAAGPPPGHSQVQEAQKEHEALILGAVAQLNQALGPETSAKLQNYIETSWAPHVTVHALSVSKATPGSPSTVRPHPEAHP